MHQADTSWASKNLDLRPLRLQRKPTTRVVGLERFVAAVLVVATFILPGARGRAQVEVVNVAQVNIDWTKEAAEKAFITDFNLIKSNDSGTRIGIIFLHELYKAKPDLDPGIAVPIAQRVGRAWNSTYGPDRDRDLRAAVADLKIIGNDLVAASKGQVGLEQFIDIGKVTYNIEARMVQDFERRMALLAGESVMKEGAGSWALSTP